VYSQSLSAYCVQSLSSRKVIHSSSCSCKRPASRKNHDVDKQLVGGVLRPQAPSGAGWQRRSVCLFDATPWNSLPFSVVTAPSVNSFKNRLDKHWALQELRYDWEAELSGTGSRSRVELWVIRVLLLYLLNNDMDIEAFRFRLSHPLCYAMLCGRFCFVFSYLNISTIVWSFGKTSASTATKHYHSRTVFQETVPSGREKDYPGNVFPGNLSGEKTIRESNHPGNDRIP